MTMPATYAAFYAMPPQLTEDGAKTWITRGANFIVAYTQAPAGARFKRDNADEYMVFLPRASATIAAGRDEITATVESLTIVPPGPSTVTMREAGDLVRVFSHRAADLAAFASNRAAYADGAPDVAPLTPWPDPVGGFKLRNYKVPEFTRPGSNMRVFRSTNIMINLLTKRETPRDVKKLSPHVHADFEQGSLAIGGAYVHHCRYPWTPDMTAWREDEHVSLGNPSLMVVPPRIIHTSQNVGAEAGWLVDIFAPPRFDFSLRPDGVCNAADYPMPPVPDSVRNAPGE